MQVPESTAVTVLPETVHFEVVLEVKLIDKPLEAVADIDCVPPAVIVDGDEKLIVCDALLNVNVTPALVTSLYESFPAIVAVKVHVPYFEAVKVVLLKVQPVAVPLEMAYVTTPSVDPPDVESVKFWEYA